MALGTSVSSSVSMEGGSEFGGRASSLSREAWKHLTGAPTKEIKIIRILTLEGTGSKTSLVLEKRTFPWP